MTAGRDRCGIGLMVVGSGRTTRRYAAGATSRRLLAHPGATRLRRRDAPPQEGDRVGALSETAARLGSPPSSSHVWAGRARLLVWDASTMPMLNGRVSGRNRSRTSELHCRCTGNIRVVSRDERDGAHRPCVQASEDVRTGDRFPSF